VNWKGRIVPPSDNIIRTYRLGGGLSATFSDETRHYFGGYYHVRLRISAAVPVSSTAFDDPEEYQDALARFGATLQMTRVLEKMAVPDDQIEAVRTQLLESFDANVLPYLLRDDFADSFVQSEYRKALVHKSPLFG
jgi:hypothetical protein